MSDHAVAVELYYGGTWNAAPAYTRDGITLSRGAPGEGQESPPSSASLTLADDAGDYSPAAAVVGRNTPIRVKADGTVRLTGELGSLAPDRTLDGRDAWAKVVAGGILRRLQQGKTPLRSALERAIVASSPVAFWPLYDGKDATALLSGMGGDPLLLEGARPGQVDGPTASGSVAFLDVAGDPVSARGRIPTGLPAAGWSFEFIVYIGQTSDPGEQTEQVLMSFPVAGYLWRVWVGMLTSGQRYLAANGYLTNGTELATGNSVDVTEGWNHVRITLEQVSGNGTMTMYVNGLNNGGIGSDTGAGTMPAPSADLFVGQTVPPLFPQFTFDVVGVGMLAFYPGLADHSDAATGYAGELAGERFLRVGAEVGIPVAVVGDETDTQPMGPQPLDTVVNVLRECVRTDDGLMFEPRDDRALVMRTGRSLRNQDPVATLSFLDGFAPGFVPVTDDANTRNDVTAQRAGGGSYQAVKTAGPLNVADPIDDPEGVGRYDTTIDVNPASDDRLVHHAYWALSKGTIDEPRYPTVTIDLDASPALIATINALDIGDRVDIDDLPVTWSLEAVPTILLGVKESYPSGAGDFRRKVTLNLGPYSPYEVLLAGNTSGSIALRGMRIGTERSTVDGSHTSGDTTILIDSDGIPWSTRAGDYDASKNGGPLYLLLGRELVQVTSVAGAGSSWTLTVTRAVNGISGTIADGTPVRFRYPGRIGL
jgi:hypothetical protein